MSAKFENQQPHWTPGRQTAYHVLTFGWLIDELMRRIDPKQRNVAEFFREEIARVYGK
jgi:hypothetical protein